MVSYPFRVLLGSQSDNPGALSLLFISCPFKGKCFANQKVKDVTGGEPFGTGQKTLLCSKSVILVACVPSKPPDVLMCPMPSETRPPATGIRNHLLAIQRLGLTDGGEDRCLCDSSLVAFLN